MSRKQLIQSPRSRTSTSQSSNSSDMEAMSETAFCFDPVSVQDTTDVQMYTYSSGRVEADTGSLHSSRVPTPTVRKELDGKIPEDTLLECLRRNCSSIVSEEGERLVDTNVDSLQSSPVPTQTAEDKLLECLRRSSSSSASEESERRSNQENELACLHGVQKRYQDAPQLDDMPLPVQEEHPGTSLCVMSESHYLFSCTLKAV